MCKTDIYIWRQNYAHRKLKLQKGNSQQNSFSCLIWHTTFCAHYYKKVETMVPSCSSETASLHLFLHFCLLFFYKILFPFCWQVLFSNIFCCTLSNIDLSLLYIANISEFRAFPVFALLQKVASCHTFFRNDFLGSEKLIFPWSQLHYTGMVYQYNIWTSSCWFHNIM